jgi:hypothetical protein
MGRVAALALDAGVAIAMREKGSATTSLDPLLGSLMEASI